MGGKVFRMGLSDMSAVFGPGGEIVCASTTDARIAFV